MLTINLIKENFWFMYKNDIHKYLECKKNKGLSQSTLRVYKLDLDDLNKFCNENNLSILDKDFEKRITAYFSNVKNYSKASIKRHLSSIKQFYQYYNEIHNLKVTNDFKFECDYRYKRNEGEIYDLSSLLNDVDRIIITIIRNNHTLMNSIRNKCIILMISIAKLKNFEVLNLKMDGVHICERYVMITISSRNKPIFVYHEQFIQTLSLYNQLFHEKRKYYFERLPGIPLSEVALENITKKFGLRPKQLLYFY